MGCLRRGQCLKITVFFRVKKSSFIEGHFLSAFLPTSYKLTQSPKTSPFVCFPEPTSFFLQSLNSLVISLLCNLCLSCLQALFLQACSSLKKKKKKKESFSLLFPLAYLSCCLLYLRKVKVIFSFTISISSLPLIFQPITVRLPARYLLTRLYLRDSPIML